MDVLTAAVIALGLAVFAGILAGGQILARKVQTDAPDPHPVTTPPGQLSELEGRVAALERRQTDLEADVDNKLKRASSRQRRAEQLQREEMDQVEAADRPADDQLHLPGVEAPGGHATLDQVRARARARRQA